MRRAGRAWASRSAVVLMLAGLAGALTAARVHPSPGDPATLGRAGSTSTLAPTAAAPTAAAPTAAAPTPAAPTPTASRPGPALDEPVFRLPFDTDPGPDTWLLLQPFGNTVFAYQNRTAIYHAGQGLHFGVDFAARCGTEVVAIGDGVVSSADNVYHGAGPHNLMINHPDGLASFYGHLLSAPFVTAGEAVTAGQVIGLTGDPDLTCTSRPHLHLEIRDAPAHRRAFDPLPLIDADWNRIALAGGSAIAFEQDLDAPDRWQFIGEQPIVVFGQPLLNAYDAAWP